MPDNGFLDRGDPLKRHLDAQPDKEPIALPAITSEA
jgi:hypothetical protein